MRGTASTETRSTLTDAERIAAAARILRVGGAVSAADLADLPAGSTAAVRLPGDRVGIAVHDGRGVWVMASPVADALDSAALAAIGVARLWVP